MSEIEEAKAGCEADVRSGGPRCGARDLRLPNRCVLPEGHAGLHRDNDERDAAFADSGRGPATAQLGHAKAPAVPEWTAERWAWHERVDNSFDIDSGGTIVIWLRRLANGESELKLTPDQAEELARAFQFAAGAAREIRSAQAPEPAHG